MEELDIKSLYERELEETMAAMGEKPFKGRQLFEWLHKKTVGSYGQMTNLSQKLRQQLEEKYPLAHRNICSGWQTAT